MSNTPSDEDTSDNLIIVDEFDISPFSIPGNEQKIFLQFQYGESNLIDETLLAKDIVNVLSPAHARELIARLQQSLDELEGALTSPKNVSKH
nr:hypothetical protein [Providencia rettgeri]